MTKHSIRIILVTGENRNRVMDLISEYDNHAGIKMLQRMETNDDSGSIIFADTLGRNFKEALNQLRENGICESESGSYNNGLLSKIIYRKENKRVVTSVVELLGNISPAMAKELIEYLTQG